MTKITYKPCPFCGCGKIKKTQKTLDIYILTTLTCVRCGANISSHSLTKHLSEQNAKYVWNLRKGDWCE